MDKIRKISHSHNQHHLQKLDALLQPLEFVLEGMPKISLPASSARQLRQGQSVKISHDLNQRLPQSSSVFVVHQDEAVALAHRQQNLLKPKRVFIHHPYHSYPKRVPIK